MAHFTPVASALGGMLIGLSAALLWLMNGRIAGTNGHGVCGLARLSPRSITATLLFIAAAGVTVFVTRHALGG
jgi:uncharacterized membrane protein YedE/YeeE